jgi:hypothetical protein
MDDWGKTLGESSKLTHAEKGEIVACLFEGFKRQNKAFGYARAFRGLVHSLSDGIESLVAHIPFDVVKEIKESNFYKISNISQDDFENDYCKMLDQFVCPMTNTTF